MMGEIYPVVLDIRVFTQCATYSINPRSADTGTHVEMIKKI